MVLRLGRRAGCSPIWAELPFKGFPTSEKMPPSPYVERAPFGSYPKAFELLKGHLAVSLRTQTSAFGRMRELPSRAVRENTDRQSSSLGCKIRQNIRKPAGTTPQAATTTPQAATWLKNDTSTDILLFICTDKPKDVRQSAGWSIERDSCPNGHWLVATDTWLSVSPAVSLQGE